MNWKLISLGLSLTSAIIGSVAGIAGAIGKGQEFKNELDKTNSEDEES